VIIAVNTEQWTADVQVLDHLYEGVQVSHLIREDLLTVGRNCQVAIVVLGDSTDALVMCTFGGRPPSDPSLDPEYGHRHRGLAYDGPRLSHAELVE
jgi:hypothetical protein